MPSLVSLALNPLPREDGPPFHDYNRTYEAPALARVKVLGGGYKVQEYHFAKKLFQKFLSQHTIIMQLPKEDAAANHKFGVLLVRQ